MKHSFRSSCWGQRLMLAASALAQTATKPPPSPRPPPSRPRPAPRRQPAAAVPGQAAARHPAARAARAPSGLRAAAAGHRARRDGRRPDLPTVLEQRRARPLPPHLPGAGGRPVRPGRRRDRQAQRQDPDGLCRRPAPAQPGLPPRATNSSPPGCRNTTTIPMRRRSTGWRWPAARPARANSRRRASSAARRARRPSPPPAP